MFYVLPLVIYLDIASSQQVSTSLLSAINILLILLTFLGSSSSALGLQSLGLSGQAPSSSSLDAGTLSDTTASGKKTTAVVECDQLKVRSIRIDTN